MYKTVVLVFAATAMASLVRYDGSSVLRCSLPTMSAKHTFNIIASQNNFDVWAEHPESIDVRVDDVSRRVLTDAFDCVPYIANLQKFLEEEDARLEISRTKWLASREDHEYRADPDTDSYYDTYHRFDEIMDKVEEIAAEYPELITISNFGKSLESRQMRVLHMTSSKNPTSKKTIYVQGGIHAREWISSATVTYIVNALAYNYGRDNATTAMMDEIEYVIVPHVNPDGFEWSWTNDRMWRKNRNNNNGNTCKGVDLNRNYDVYWGGAGTNMCSEDYQGASVASEIETKNTQNYVAALTNKIGAIDMHSYGQYIMRPYGWTRTLHPDEAIISQLGSAVVDAIYDVHGVRYSSIRSAELYPVTGATDDWFTVKQDLWGFCWELRDNGRYGFRLPEDQILPTGQEVFRGLLAYSEFLLDEFDPVN